MMTIMIELDAPSTKFDPLTLSKIVLEALDGTPMEGVLINRVSVEREDAH